MCEDLWKLRHSEVTSVHCKVGVTVTQTATLTVILYSCVQHYIAVLVNIAIGQATIAMPLANLFGWTEKLQ